MMTRKLLLQRASQHKHCSEYKVMFTMCARTAVMSAVFMSEESGLVDLARVLGL